MVSLNTGVPIYPLYLGGACHVNHLYLDWRNDVILGRIERCNEWCIEGCIEWCIEGCIEWMVYWKVYWLVYWMVYLIFWATRWRQFREMKWRHIKGRLYDVLRKRKKWRIKGRLNGVLNGVLNALKPASRQVALTNSYGSILSPGERPSNLLPDTTY